jgi:hypothetical protein
MDGIPISWISAWFRQSRWKKLRDEWNGILSKYGEGKRRPKVPELGLHWSLGYQKDVNGKQKMFESSIFKDE